MTEHAGLLILVKTIPLPFRSVALWPDLARSIADLADYGLDGITRLAISPKMDKIVIVVNE